MALDLKWTRRTFMGSLGAIAGTMLSSKKLFGKAALAGGKGAAKISGFGGVEIDGTPGQVNVKGVRINMN